MNTMLPDSKASLCLAVLREGPATTAEVAVETGLGSKSACAHLFDLMKRKKVKREPFRSGMCRWLWSVA